MNDRKLYLRLSDYESGKTTSNEMIKLFQDLIDSGLVWSLQGSYGRTAQRLLDDGLCKVKAKNEGQEPPI